MSDYASSIEWAEDNQVTWTMDEVQRVLHEHGIYGDAFGELTSFRAELGVRQLYEAAAVLRWLGY